MRQLDFEPAEFAQRLGRLRQALAEQAVDAMLVHDPANVYWLTGWRGKGYQQYQPLLVTVDDAPERLSGTPQGGPQDRAWFLQMLRRANPAITDDDIDRLAAAAEAYHRKIWHDEPAGS